ncbi:hypothetical protein HID58_002444 [Brassica napus]|uniref:ABC-2 type transporter transmembrane domain-containing protein n=1 Tax=Brassica napus TaxID=3708 RepID=A0ABQ8EM92_BRANA|nr:hypothetical protein HID58_002444 [Brassica napus]
MTAISANIFATSFAVNSSDLLTTLANNILGSPIAADKDNYADPGLAPGLLIYSIQPLCNANSTWPLSLEKIQTVVKCVQGLCLWRNNSADVNNELFKGSYRGNPTGITNEIAAAYDLMSTDKKNFNVTIWYNSTYKDEFSTEPVKLISNPYLKFLKGPGLRILFEFIKERKHIWTNVRLILVPLFLCLITLAIQHVLDALMKGVSDMTGDCKSNADLSGGICPIPKPPMLPAMLQIPQHELRSVKTDFLPYKDLPEKSCRGTMGGSCPVTILMTGDKQPLGKAISTNIFATSFAVNSSDLLPTLANNILGSPIAANKYNYPDPGLAPGLPIYKVKCVQGLCLWRNNSADVNNELFKGSYRGNPAGITNEIAVAYDLMSTDKKNFNMNTDIASLLGPLFFTWVVLLLFPVILTSLVYEKQERLRIIMKMHGLGDGPYWLISYAFFLTISVLYVVSLVIFGSVIGLKYFRLNSYTIQSVFYFIYLNLQIAIGFLVSSIFSKVKTVTVVSYILVYGTGLLGSFFFQTMLENQSFPEEWIVALELYPGFSLYRGLYEFSQYASRGNGMKWQDLSDSGMGEFSQSGKHPFFFLNPFKKSSSIPSKPTVQRVDSKKVSIDMGKIDVSQEREKVQQLRNEGRAGHAILCDNLKKVYPSRDGNPPKMAVRGLYLDVPSGECFGMLGPNGAGKTSFISMVSFTKTVPQTKVIECQRL